VVVVDAGTTAFAVVVGCELLLSPVHAAPTSATTSTASAAPRRR